MSKKLFLIFVLGFGFSFGGAKGVFADLTVSPSCAYRGQTITITGGNFGTTPGSICLSKPSLIGYPCGYNMYTSWTNSQIVATVPNNLQGSELTTPFLIRITPSGQPTTTYLTPAPSFNAFNCAVLDPACSCQPIMKEVYPAYICGASDIELPYCRGPRIGVSQGFVVENNQCFLMSWTCGTTWPAGNCNCMQDGEGVFQDMNYIDASHLNTCLRPFYAGGRTGVIYSQVNGQYKAKNYSCVAGATATPTPISSPIPTPTAVLCGTSVGATCCATSPKCVYNTSPFLFCFSNACQSFVSKSMTASLWYNSFVSNNADYDFDNNGRVGGLDYALWLKAGNTL